MAAVERVIERVGPYRFAGKVVKGFQRGSKQLGWPTANLDPAAFEKQLDASTEGVYIGWASIADPTLPEEARAVHKAILSIGWNPQFENKERTVEAYITHDFQGRDFYDAQMNLLVCAFIRPQAKFESFQHLIDAITADVEFGRNALDTPELVELRADGLFGAAAESAGAAPQALDDRAYLEHFGVHAALSTALATVVKERPTNPLLTIAELLSKSK
jgi:riboflavin kinase